MRSSGRRPTPRRPNCEVVRISGLVPAFNEAQGLAGTLAGIRTAMAVFEARGWAAEAIAHQVGTAIG